MNGMKNNVLPKVELHVHLEGTVSPALAVRLAERNKTPLPEGIFKEDGQYNWNTFPEFIQCYDVVSSVIKTPEDYVDVTYDYLASIAKEGAIYAELTLGPDIAAMFGMDYTTYLGAVAQGIDKATRDFGIHARMIICMIRHMGPEVALELMKTVEKHPHPYVVGVGLAGNEMVHQPQDFAAAFRFANEVLNLGCTAHAGEVVGPEGVWATIDHLPVTRIGHGVRSIDDPALVKALHERGITLEVCPNSNIALHVYPDYAAHPLRKLFNAGVVGSINSDDPPFFWTTLAADYDAARQHFGFTDAELLTVTRRAVEVSFADDALKQELLQQVEAYALAA